MSKAQISAFLLISLLAVAACGYKVDTDSRMIIDDQGRARIFHGVNAVIKVAPFAPETEEFSADMSMNADDIAYMKKWGINHVRLGVMWVAVEPVQGQYNMTYLETMKNLTDTLGENGITTIIDMHQDVFGRKYCGEGFPDWVVEAIPAKDKCSGIIGTVAHWLGICKPLAEYDFHYDSAGNPEIADCLENMFAGYYAMPEVSSSFQYFYDSTELQESFAAYWKVMAQTFHDSPSVLGYDFLNEPWVGDIWSDITDLVPGKIDRKVLQPMYQRLNEVVRAVDDKKIVFFEPVQDDKLGILGGFVFNTGFTETPAPATYDDRQMLNFHVYCCQKGATVCKNGEPELSEAPKCKVFNQNTVETRTNNAIMLNVGSFLTEFGACFNTDSCVQEIKSITEAADSKFVSWAYWQYKGFGDYTTSGSYKEGLFNQDGTPQDKKVHALARSYAPAIAGVPTFLRYDLDTNTFGLSFQVDPTIQEGTEIYLNQVAAEADKIEDYHITILTDDGKEGKFDKTDKGNGLLSFVYAGENTISRIIMSFTITPYFTAGSVNVDKYNIKFKQVSDQPGLTRISVLPGATYADTLEFRLVDMEGERMCSMELKGSTPSSMCQTHPVRLPGYKIEIYKTEFLVEVKKGEFTMGAINGMQYLIEVDDA